MVIVSPIVHYQQFTALVPLTFLVLLFYGPSFVHTFPSYTRKFPNLVRYCERGGVIEGPGQFEAFGHANCNSRSGKGKYKNIGFDFMAFGREWNLPFCLHDSDGDGYTNGEELGDPCCVYLPGKSESPLIHNLTGSDPSSFTSIPEIPTCSTLDLPLPNIREVKILVGKSKAKLELPNFKAHSGHPCLCNALITIVPLENQLGMSLEKPPTINVTKPFKRRLIKSQSGHSLPRSSYESSSSYLKTIGEFWHLSGKSRSLVLYTLEENGIEVPEDLLVPHSSVDFETKNRTDIVEPRVEVIHAMRDGFLLPEQYRRDYILLNLMAELQPSALHFTIALSERSPVICSSSIYNKAAEFAAVLKANAVSIRVQFKNWQKIGPLAMLDIPVIQSHEMDPIPCSDSRLSEISVSKSERNYLEPCAKSAILLAILLGLFLITSFVLRFLIPGSPIHRFFLQQRHLECGGKYISSELWLVFFTLAVFGDICYLIVTVMRDSTRVNKPTWLKFGDATGYGSAVALAGTTFLAARRHNIFQLSDPGSFAKSVKYHILLGHAAMIMVITHGTIKIISSKFDFNRFGLFSGFLVGMCMLISYFGTFNVIREKFYEIFRMLHFLMPIGLGLGVWHLTQITRNGSITSIVVLGTSISLYLLDKIVSGIQDWLFKPAEITLVRLGRMLGQNEMDLQEHVLFKIKHEGETFHAGQWVHIWIPKLGLVSHPFSIMPTIRECSDLENQSPIDEQTSDGKNENAEGELSSNQHNLLGVNFNGIRQSYLVKKTAHFRAEFELIIRVQPGAKRFGFYTPWTRRLFDLLASQAGGIFDVFDGQLTTCAKASVPLEHTQPTFSRAQRSSALQLKVCISRPHGPTKLNQAINNADSIVIIAGGSGISAVLGDLAVLPIDKLNMFYWTFRPPYLLDWLYPKFAHIPPQKRKLFCKTFCRDYELFETPTKSFSPVNEVRKEVSPHRMDVTAEIEASVIRVLESFTFNSSPNEYPCGFNDNIKKPIFEQQDDPDTLNAKGRLLCDTPTPLNLTDSSLLTIVTNYLPTNCDNYQRKRRKTPTLLVLFCGPASLKAAVIEACKNEKERNRLNLILDVQSLSF